MHLCTPGPVVQWIEYKIPVLTIWVRFPSGLPGTGAQQAHLCFFLSYLGECKVGRHLIYSTKIVTNFDHTTKIAYLIARISLLDTPVRNTIKGIRTPGANSSYTINVRFIKSDFKKRGARPVSRSASEVNPYATYAIRFR